MKLFHKLRITPTNMSPTRMLVMLACLLLLMNCCGKCQLVTSFGAGYSTAHAVVCNLQVGFVLRQTKDDMNGDRLVKDVVYYSQSIHITDNANVPKILGLRYGYNIGSFQPNAGFDYHLLSSDKYRRDKPDEGFHFAFGVTKYFKAFPLKIDAGMSGKHAIGFISMYKIFD